MSKHHVILKSKTLDVPIIITSSISDENQFSFSEAPSTEPISQIQPVSAKFKLDKGFSLDSHYLKSQNSLSSSSTSNDMTSSSNSMSSSTNSLQQQHFTNFQFHNQQYLQPPPAVSLTSMNTASQTININADFDVCNSIPLYERFYEKRLNKLNPEANNSNPNIHLI